MSPWWAVATYVVAVLTAGGLVRLFDPAASADAPSWLWFAPAVAAGVTWLVGRRALAVMLPASVPRRQMVAHTILGVAAALVLVGLVAVGLALVPHETSGAGTGIGLALALAVPAAFALELGWRAVLQPLVEPRLGRMWGSVAVGVVWAAWRLELDDAAGIVSTLVTSIALSILLGHLAGGSWWQRWITAGVAQTILSVGLVLLVGIDPSGGAALVVAAASVVVTTVWLLMFRAATRRRAARVTSSA